MGNTLAFLILENVSITMIVLWDEKNQAIYKENENWQEFKVDPIQ